MYKFGETTFEEKKSRFIAHVKPIKTEEEAIAFIDELKTKYWDATHNVYAYDIHNETVTQRFSDDGEPQGTAGLPIIELIKKMGLANIVVVVTRYFGGTMLGASGLIRAYGKSASMGVEAAIIVKQVLCSKISVIVDYSTGGKVQNFALNRGHNISNTNYAQDVEFEFILPCHEEESFIETIIDLTNNNALIETKDKEFVIFDLEGKLIKE